jgi:hypothetical protein
VLLEMSIDLYKSKRKGVAVSAFGDLEEILPSEFGHNPVIATYKITSGLLMV